MVAKLVICGTGVPMASTVYDSLRYLNVLHTCVCRKQWLQAAKQASGEIEWEGGMRGSPPGIACSTHQSKHSLACFHILLPSSQGAVAAGGHAGIDEIERQGGMASTPRSQPSGIL